MKNPDTGALILDGTHVALGVVRNLAKHHVSVWIVDPEPNIARYSRDVQGYFRPPPDGTDDQQVDFLLRLADEQHFQRVVLLADSDSAVKLLAQHGDRLRQRYIVNSLPWEVIQYFYDKRLTNQLAQQQGVPIPFCLTLSDIEDITSHDLVYPLVLKPAFYSIVRWVTGKKAFLVNNLEELKSVFHALSLFIEPDQILIQEYLSGHSQNLCSYCGYFKDGQPLYGITVRRPRQNPQIFGINTYVETADIPELRNMAEQIMKTSAYSGMAEVEFMFNVRSQRFELLEVNPRIWGFHTIAIRAGLDLPYYAYLDALGEPIPAPQKVVDARWVRLLTDIPAGVNLVRSGSLSLGDYLRSLTGNLELATFSLRDPLPAVMEVLIKAHDLLQRRRQQSPEGLAR